MLNRLPKHMPTLAMMLADLGNPRPDHLAKALGVSVKSVYRWKRAEHAPRPALLAIFWLTRWGMSQVHCEAHNAAMQHAAMNSALRSRIGELERQLGKLGQIADFGSANDPSRDVRNTCTALPIHQLLPVPHEPVKTTAPRVSAKKAASLRRVELAERRLAKRANGAPDPFDFLHTK